MQTRVKSGFIWWQNSLDSHYTSALQLFQQWRIQGVGGASAPPAESMVEKLNLPFFFSMVRRYLFASSVSLVKKVRLKRSHFNFNEDTCVVPVDYRRQMLWKCSYLPEVRCQSTSCSSGSRVDKRAFVSYRCCTTWLHARVVVIGDWSQVQILSIGC